MTNEIKKSARRFLKEYRIKKLTVDRISEIIRSQGYKIIRFGKAYNDENTEIWFFWKIIFQMKKL